MEAELGELVGKLSSAPTNVNAVASGIVGRTESVTSEVSGAEIQAWHWCRPPWVVLGSGVPFSGLPGPIGSCSTGPGRQGAVNPGLACFSEGDVSNLNSTRLWTNAAPKTLSQDTPICWICLDAGSDLIFPCKCPR
jgi:hypothetical protein